MRKRTRYLFIVFGFIVFFVIAPLVVLYINGLHFSFDESGYEPTGIFVAKTEPKGAQLFLNDKLSGKTPATVRFLKPGEYSILIHSDGYFDWTKRLEVKPNLVTRANNNIDKILLIRQNPASTTIGSGGLDFVVAGDQILYLTAQNLVVASATDLTQNQNFALPKQVSQITALNDSGLYLLRGSKTSLIFSSADNKFTDISALVLPDDEIAITPDHAVLSLEQGKLSQIDLASRRKTALANNIRAFTLLNRDIYYIQDDHNKTTLMVSPLSEMQRGPGTLLLSPIPSAKTYEIIVTPQKEIAVLLDQTLYRINSQLEHIADNIIDWNFNETEDVLAITTGGELDYYSFADNSRHFITRSSAAISNARVRPATGYAFFITQNQFHALELDDRDGQNDYVLASSLVSPKFFLNNNSAQTILMSNGEVKTLEIR